MQNNREAFIVDCRVLIFDVNDFDDAFGRYLETIPHTKRFRGITYDIKDVIGRTGTGIGSAGLPAYTFLIEGFNQALDNDVVLSTKQGNVAAPGRVIDNREVHDYFKHHDHRTALSQRALQAHADPLLGYTDIDGVGFVVSEISPYDSDLDWSELTEPDELTEVIGQLGQAVAKAHCVSDTDSDQTLVDFQTAGRYLRMMPSLVAWMSTGRPTLATNFS